MAANNRNTDDSIDVPPKIETCQADVHIDRDTWKSIATKAQALYEGGGKDPEVAYWDALHEHLELVPNVVVDGEAKGLEDVDGLPSSNGETADHGAGSPVALQSASTKAYLAVGLLDGAAGPDTYHGRDVREAIDHLEDGLADAPEGSDTAEQLRAALKKLEEIDDASRGARGLLVHDALAELAPVAAGLTDHDRAANGTAVVPGDEKPTVPVFYNVPETAADRAIDRFRRRRERVEAGDTGMHLSQRSTLSEFVLDEIDEQLEIFVGSEPYATYASKAGVTDLVVDPDVDATEQDEETDDR